jgi:uncharacterized protein (DUF1501 family)
MDTRSLALGLAANRVLFGTAFLVAPERAARSWIGRAAASAGGGVMVRAAGARDLALGAGALAALRGSADARPWLAAHLVSDAADAAATWAARRELGTARTAYAMFMGCASAAIAAGYLVDRATSSTPPAERSL